MHPHLGGAVDHEIGLAHEVGEDLLLSSRLGVCAREADEPLKGVDLGVRTGGLRDLADGVGLRPPCLREQAAVPYEVPGLQPVAVQQGQLAQTRAGKLLRDRSTKRAEPDHDGMLAGETFELRDARGHV